MEAALILLAALLGVGLLLYLHHRLTGGKHTDTAPAPDNTPAETAEGEGCCGMHITCERDSLLSAVSEKIEYFDDEELDRFASRGDKPEYTDAETEEFREVLLSMPPDNIAPWARSLQLRGITLPEAVRDELLLIVSEERAARAASH